MALLIKPNTVCILDASKEFHLPYFKQQSSIVLVKFITSDNHQKFGLAYITDNSPAAFRQAIENLKKAVPKDSVITEFQIHSHDPVPVEIAKENPQPVKIQFLKKGDEEKEEKNAGYNLKIDIKGEANIDAKVECTTIPSLISQDARIQQIKANFIEMETDAAILFAANPQAPALDATKKVINTFNYILDNLGFLAQVNAPEHWYPPNGKMDDEHTKDFVIIHVRNFFHFLKKSDDNFAERTAIYLEFMEMFINSYKNLKKQDQQNNNKVLRSKIFFTRLMQGGEGVCLDARTKSSTDFAWSGLMQLHELLAEEIELITCNEIQAQNEELNSAIAILEKEEKTADVIVSLRKNFPAEKDFASENKAEVIAAAKRLSAKNAVEIVEHKQKHQIEQSGDFFALLNLIIAKKKLNADYCEYNNNKQSKHKLTIANLTRYILSSGNVSPTLAGIKTFLLVNNLSVADKVCVLERCLPNFEQHELEDIQNFIRTTKLDSRSKYLATVSRALSPKAQLLRLASLKRWKEENGANNRKLPGFVQILAPLTDYGDMPKEPDTGDNVGHHLVRDLVQKLIQVDKPANEEKTEIDALSEALQICQEKLSLEEIKNKLKEKFSGFKCIKIWLDDEEVLSLAALIEGLQNTRNRKQKSIDEEKKAKEEIQVIVRALVICREKASSQQIKTKLKQGFADLPLIIKTVQNDLSMDVLIASLENMKASKEKNIKKPEDLKADNFIVKDIFLQLFSGTNVFFASNNAHEIPFEILLDAAFKIDARTGKAEIVNQKFADLFTQLLEKAKDMSSINRTRMLFRLLQHKIWDKALQLLQQEKPLNIMMESKGVFLIHLAAECPDPELIAMLCNHGANPGLQEEQKPFRYAFNIAQEKENFRGLAQMILSSFNRFPGTVKKLNKLIFNQLFVALASEANSYHKKWHKINGLINSAEFKQEIAKFRGLITLENLSIEQKKDVTTTKTNLKNAIKEAFTFSDLLLKERDEQLIKDEIQELQDLIEKSSVKDIDFLLAKLESKATHWQRENQISWGFVKDLLQTNLEKIDVNIAQYKGQRLIHLAALENRSEILQLLVKRNVNLEVINHKGLTPLDIADAKAKAFLEHELKYEKLLLPSNIRFERNGQTLLFLARKGLWDQAIQFIEKNPDIDFNVVHEDDGNSVLHYAADDGRGDIIKKVISLGANPVVRNKSLQIPLELVKLNLAQVAAQPSAYEVLTQPENLAKIDNYHFYTDRSGDFGFSCKEKVDILSTLVLRLARDGQVAELLRLLADKNIYVDYTDKSTGKGVLDFAVQHLEEASQDLKLKWHAVIRILCQKGLDPTSSAWFQEVGLDQCLPYRIVMQRNDYAALGIMLANSTKLQMLPHSISIKNILDKLFAENQWAILVELINSPAIKQLDSIEYYTYVPKFSENGQVTACLLLSAMSRFENTRDLGYFLNSFSAGFFAKIFYLLLKEKQWDLAIKFQQEFPRFSLVDLPQDNNAVLLSAAAACQPNILNKLIDLGFNPAELAVLPNLAANQQEAAELKEHKELNQPKKATAFEMIFASNEQEKLKDKALKTIACHKALDRKKTLFNLIDSKQWDVLIKVCAQWGFIGAGINRNGQTPLQCLVECFIACKNADEKPKIQSVIIMLCQKMRVQGNNKPAENKAGENKAAESNAEKNKVEDRLPVSHPLQMAINKQEYALAKEMLVHSAGQFKLGQIKNVFQQLIDAKEINLEFLVVLGNMHNVDLQMKRFLGIRLIDHFIKKANDIDEVFALVQQLNKTQLPFLQDRIKNAGISFNGHTWNNQATSGTWTKIMKLAKNRILELKLDDDRQVISVEVEKFLNQKREAHLLDFAPAKSIRILYAAGVNVKKAHEDLDKEKQALELQLPTAVPAA